MKISQFLRRDRPSPTPNATNGDTNIMDAIGNYSKMSEEELLTQFVEEANREKKNGTFDKSALENFYSTASPMLTPEQRAKMRDLIDQIS